MRVNVNLNNVDESGTIPEGWYAVRVVESEIRDNADNTSQYIRWTLEIIEGEAAGQKIWLNSSLKDRGLPMLKRFLMAAQFDWEESGFDPTDVYGCELEVSVVVGEYMGRKQNEVKNYRAI